MGLADNEPLLRMTWTDPVTGRNGYLVVQSLVSGMATGGTRLRAGCTLTEVEDLARGMASKAAVYGLPVGGAKGGVDCDPRDPGAKDMLRRFMSAMRPWLNGHWVTAEDLGVPQHFIDDIFESLGMDQSFHAAITRSADPAATLRRIRAGMSAPVPGGYLLGDVVGGYGVAQSCLGSVDAWEWDYAETTVAIQGVGTMGGGAAFYLHEAGLKVVCIADAAGALYDPNGLDIPALLDLRDAYGEIDRTQVPEHVQRLPREDVLSTPVDIMIPAATSYAITAQNVEKIDARLVVEAANAATRPEAEQRLAERGIPVLPDFVANAGAAAWAWWLILGRVGAEPVDSFTMLRNEVRSRVAPLIHAWNTERVTPRTTALAYGDAHLEQAALAEEAGEPVALSVP